MAWIEDADRSVFVGPSRRRIQALDASWGQGQARRVTRESAQARSSRRNRPARPDWLPVGVLDRHDKDAITVG